MRKEEKIEKLKNLEEQFKNSKHFIFTEYKGLKTQQINILREKLRKVNSQIMVIKNTLGKIAYKNVKVQLDDTFFEGPLSIVFCKNDDFVSTLKILYDFVKENESFKIKFGVLENKKYDSSQLKELSNLPSKQELIAKFLAGMNYPVTSLVFSLKFVLYKLLNVLKAIEDKQK